MPVNIVRKKYSHLTNISLFCSLCADHQNKVLMKQAKDRLLHETPPTHCYETQLKD